MEPPHSIVDAMSAASALLHRLVTTIKQVIIGKDEVIVKLVATFATGGHVLLEDMPGAGKTTLAKALARAVGTSFQRVQFTPDQLPSDILGLSVFDPRDRSFKLHRGPIFTDILLADEINRASPRTQSALLEAMAEGQVSLDGESLPLSPGFFVIATQNPVEFHGTYPLPEAQMDRFAVRLTLGYVTRAEEIGFTFDHLESHPLDTVTACTTLEEVLACRHVIAGVAVATPIRSYIVDLVAATRQTAGVKLGASPRASLALAKTAQALAVLRGRSFVIPEDVQDLAVPVIAHRLVLEAGARFSGETSEQVVCTVIRSLPVPC